MVENDHITPTTQNLHRYERRFLRPNRRLKICARPSHRTQHVPVAVKCKQTTDFSSLFANEDRNRTSTRIHRSREAWIEVRTVESCVRRPHGMPRVHLASGQ